MLTVLTWLWKQKGSRVDYTAMHVNIWAAMVSRHLTIPHRLACVTDYPEGIDPRVEIIPEPKDFEGVTIPSWGSGRPNCFRRISLFRRDAAALFGDRFVSMDLDCVVGASLDPLFSRSEDIVLYSSPRGGQALRPYNGSMVMMSAGARPEVFEDFTVEGATEAGRKYIGSDQSWISHRLGRGEATWSEEDGVAWNQSPPHVLRRVKFYPGPVKPWDDFARGDEWVRKNYRAESKDRALILGYSKNVWDDAEQAIQEPYQGVIASPEAAEHWPGPIDAVGGSDEECVNIASMLGFERWTICGQTELLTSTPYRIAS